MKKALVVILILGLGLYTGFFFARKRIKICETPVSRVTVVEEVPPTTVVESKLNMKEEMALRKEVYDSLSSDYRKAVNIFNNQLLSLSKASEYLRQQTEDAQKAGSIEGSLVLEARFRESLQTMIGIQQQILALRDRFITDAGGYTAYLENLILQNASD